MKKIFKAVLLIIFLCGAVFFAASCEEEHVHVPGEWVIDTEATCKAAGGQHKSCVDCGEILETEDIPKLEHTPVIDEAVSETETENGLTEGSHCSVCGEVLVPQEIVFAKLQGTELSSVAMELEGTALTVSLPNNTEKFSFMDDIKVTSGASYTVSTDPDCVNTVHGKVVELSVGDNRFYILVTNGDDTELYDVNIRRKPMYTVTFDSVGGTEVQAQTVEEESFAAVPNAPELSGYTFLGWDHDFSQPIRGNMTVKAIWGADGDTLYRIEYYYEDLTKSKYELNSSVHLKGETDTQVSITPDTVYGFTLDSSKSKLSGRIDGSETLVLKVYYTRNTYTVSVSVENGSHSGGGIYPYGTEITVKTTAKAGYTFKGWYCSEEKVSSKSEYTFTVDKDLELSANITANVDTLYTIEYYYENLTKSGYELKRVVTMRGETDTQAKVTPEAVVGFTLNASKSNLSGNIDASEMLVLKVCYARNTYTVTCVASNGDVSGAGRYPYGSEIAVRAVPYLGYSFVGWFEGENKISSGSSYSYKVIADLVLTAQFTVADEMENFGFTSTVTTCVITGIKDKTVKEITVPAYVTDINCNAFSGCSALEGITVPFVGGSKNASNASNKTLFGYIFGSSDYEGGRATIQYYSGSDSSKYYIPSSLKRVTVTGGKILYGAFYNCSDLTSVTIGEGVTSIGAYAFSDCSALTELYYNAKSCPDMKGGNYVFRNAGNNGIKLVIGNKALRIPAYLFYDDYASRITNVVFEDNGVCVSIGSSAFENCNSLINVTIPNSVTSIGGSAFEGCSSLASVAIGDGLTSIGYSAFYGCERLASITVSENNSVFKSVDGNLYSKDGTVLLQYAIGKTETAFVIPNSVTSIGSSAFENCGSLTEVTIGDKVESMGDYVFYSCGSLTSVTIGNNVTSMGDSVFENCSNLTNVAIGNRVTSIGAYVFRNCRSLKSIVIPGSVTGIGDYAFRNCSSLTSVTIPNSVTSIGNGVFYYCSSLKSITIPGSVTSIGSSAFKGCNMLESVVFVNSSGWWVSKSSSATSGDKLASSGLSNHSTAATYLRSTYSGHYWKRG